MYYSRTNYRKLLPVLLAVLLLAACRTNNNGKANLEKLKKLDDSISAKSPGAYRMIADAMNSAADSMEYYECAVRMGKYYVLSATPDSALPWLDRVDRFAAGKSSPQVNGLMAYSLNTRAGFLHNYHKNTDETLQLYHRAYDLLMKSDQKAEAPDVCANLGDAYVYENKLPEAAEWYRRALFLSDSLNLPAKNSLSLYVGLAFIYQQLGDDDKALSLYQATDKHYRDMPLSMQCYFINNYGGFYYYNRNYRSSLEQFKRLEKLLIDNGMENNFDMFLCRLNLADVYLNLGDTKKATQYLDSAEPFWKKNGDSPAIYYCNAIRLGIAVREGNMAEAGRLAASNDDDGDMIYSLRNIRNRYLREYFERKGDWQSVYKNLVAEDLEDDSLEHNRLNMRAADVMAQYSQDTIQLHRAVTIEHKNAEMERMRMWLVVAVAVVFVLVLLLLTWMMRTHRDKLRAQMQIMNLKLESARNRISPHFIFNVLNNQIVTSDKKEADRLLDLTKLIRTNLDMAGQMTVPLAEEIDFVGKYVNVEKTLLNDDKFTYSVNVDKTIDTATTLIPSMFIQILVENAFVHGLMGRDGEKRLTINIVRIDDGIRITVSDNGPGFDMRSQKGRKRTGLNIIRQTIATINGHNKRKIVFSLHNNEGGDTGCNAILTIPDNIELT